MVVDHDEAPVPMGIDALAALSLDELETILFESTNDPARGDVAEQPDGWVGRAHWRTN
ncbi:MAG TPA: hypothetical protein VLE23_17155 [Geminicoccaceae bacterium]|nr:hypothetical protein [Geminicoccaceae bacterium]